MHVFKTNSPVCSSHLKKSSLSVQRLIQPTLFVGSCLLPHIQPSPPSSPRHPSRPRVPRTPCGGRKGCPPQRFGSQNLSKGKGFEALRIQIYPTVDGSEILRAPVEGKFIPLFPRSYTFQVVQRYILRKGFPLYSYSGDRIETINPTRSGLDSYKTPPKKCASKNGGFETCPSPRPTKKMGEKNNIVEPPIRCPKTMAIISPNSFETQKVGKPKQKIPRKKTGCMKLS